MITRLTFAALIGLGWIIFALAFVAPGGALAFALLNQGPPTNGWGFSSRQLWLLAQSAALAAAGVLACLAFSLPAVYSLSNLGQFAARRAVMAMIALCLLCPPMVYVFAWQGFLPG